ncbi:hypothetical protein AB0K80_21615 [Streptomyces sp. NPDC052682]|uniref:hypothetical protein n=1 Tax=Streptomyces sp. NPDC052682 TaxID=3154954 RepID=UPI003436C3D4
MGENRSTRARAGEGGVAGGRTAVSSKGDHNQFLFASPLTNVVLLALIFLLGVVVLWPRGSNGADHRDDAAPPSPSSTGAEPRPTAITGEHTASSDLAPDGPSRTSAPPFGTPAPAPLSGDGAGATLPDCRAAGEDGVQLTPPDLEVRDRGELSARVNCETKAGERLYYMVRIDNIMDSGNAPKTGFYLKGEIAARNASEHIDVDLRHAKPASIRYGFVQLLRYDEYAELKKESDRHKGVIAALPQNSVTVSGEARITRSE